MTLEKVIFVHLCIMLVNLAFTVKNKLLLSKQFYGDIHLILFLPKGHV